MENHVNVPSFIFYSVSLEMKMVSVLKVVLFSKARREVRGAPFAPDTVHCVYIEKWKRPSLINILFTQTVCVSDATRVCYRLLRTNP